MPLPVDISGRQHVNECLYAHTSSAYHTDALACYRPNDSTRLRTSFTTLAPGLCYETLRTASPALRPGGEYQSRELVLAALYEERLWCASGNSSLSLGQISQWRGDTGSILCKKSTGRVAAYSRD